MGEWSSGGWEFWFDSERGKSTHIQGSRRIIKLNTIIIKIKHILNYILPWLLLPTVQQAAQFQKNEPPQGHLQDSLDNDIILCSFST